MRVTEFSVGRRYRCTREPGKRDRVFDFVIVGPATSDYRTEATRKQYKRCRLEVVEHGTSYVHPETGKCCDQCSQGVEQDYSHKHLKKYGVLLPLDGTEGQDRKSYTDTQDRRSYT